jgi:ADP-ribose pyrophosphatase YjhB (NUDIX family)
LAKKAKQAKTSAMLKQVVTFFVQTWFRLKRPMTLGVRVVAIDANGAVCLVRHTYTPGWHLPGGGVERGETCLQAACKEVCEEVGLIVAPQEMQLVSVHANFNNFKGDHVLVYRAASWTQGTTNNAQEIAETGFFLPEQLPEGTTPGTRRRIAELFEGKNCSQNW